MRKLTDAQNYLKGKKDKNKLKKAVQVFLYEMYIQKNTVVNNLQLLDYINDHIRLEADIYFDMLEYIQLLTQEEIANLVVQQAKEVARRKKNREKDRERVRMKRENMSEEEKEKLREYYRNYSKERRKRRREAKIERDRLRVTA